MSKTNGTGEKTKETHVAGAKPAAGTKPAGGAKPADGKTGEIKKPEVKANANAEPKAAGGRSKGHTALPGHCFSWECKAEAERFNFCSKHYDHFKFGLIKKTGEPVSDYEKKIEHYLAYQAKRGSQKVA